MDDKKILACVPCKEEDRQGMPWEPSEGCEYVESNCEECNVAVWLGTRQKVVYDEGEAEIICPFCMFEKYGEHLKGVKIKAMTGGESEPLGSPPLLQGYENVPDLRILAEDMFKVSSSYRYDHLKSIEEMEAMANCKTEKVGAMTIMRGYKNLPSLEPLTRFVYYNDQTLQVQYCRRPKGLPDDQGPDDMDYCQLTIVDSQQKEISEKIVEDFLPLFFDLSKEDDFRLVDTPDHVVIIVQVIRDDWHPSGLQK